MDKQINFFDPDLVLIIIQIAKLNILSKYAIVIKHILPFSTKIILI
jgi:hypothetical protein